MNKQLRILFLAAAVMLSAAGTAVSQKPVSKTDIAPAIQSGSLVVVDEAGRTTKLGPADLAKLKRITVTASDHGKQTTFEGVALVEVLKLGGVEFGESLRGKRLANYLLVEAADKYSVVYALAELDPGFTDKVVILADKRDGKPLPENARDWQIVAPDEKRAGRWVRQVVSLKVVRTGI